MGFCHDKKSEQVTCSEQENGAKHPSKIHDPSNTKSLTNNLWQCQTFVNNVLIDSWQCQMEINDVKSQSIKWQCRINIVDLKLLLSCSIDHSWQCRSDFNIPLSIVDQSSSIFQLVVASLNNNTSSFDDSIERSSATFKLVVVSIANEYSKGVSLGAFYPLMGLWHSQQS